MDSLPEEKRPLVGTEGAKYRRKQMMNQLPIHDHDAEYCDNLTEEEKEKWMTSARWEMNKLWVWVISGRKPSLQPNGSVHMVLTWLTVFLRHMFYSCTDSGKGTFSFCILSGVVVFRAPFI